MGKLDLQQHAPAGYPMDQMYITSTNDVARKPKHEAPKVLGSKPSSVTMVYGQITGGAPNIGNLDEDQIYDPSKRRYQNDPGVDVGGGTGRGPNRGGHHYAPRQPAPTRQFNQVPSGGEFGVQYSAKPQSAPPPARQDSAGRSLQIKVNSVANPSMASPTVSSSMQDVGPVNYSSSGQINLRQQQQQQQPQRHIQTAPSNSSATAPTIAAFNCTVEDAPAGYSRARPGQQFAPVKSAATFNQPTYNQPQANLYNQPQNVSHGPQNNYGPSQSSQSKYGAQILDNNPSPFAQSYGPEKSFKTGPRPQVRGMQAKQPPQRKGAPFAVEPQRSGPPPPGGPRGGRPVYSDF